jgi:hypothetical protein
MFIYRINVIGHHWTDMEAGMANLFEIARAWREAKGYVGRGGVIVIYEGEVNSWVDKLRNPEHWVPGCIAIDEAGNSWMTIAGTARDGSLMWLPRNPVE